MSTEETPRPLVRQSKSQRNAPIDAGSFSQQEVELQKSPLFFPAGYEKIFIAIYFVIVPYIIGIAFTFIYLAQSNLEMFMNILQETPVALTWAIGYEILAALLLLYIIKSAVAFVSKPKEKGPIQHSFKRP